MSDELISLSDFLDWADFCASVYGRRSLTLIERSVLLGTLSASVNTNKDRLRWSISRAVEYGRRGCYADMLKECQDVMRHENARDVYQRLYSYARYMPTAGTIEARLQKGVIIHEKH